jgi:hypothetical protein
VTFSGLPNFLPDFLPKVQKSPKSGPPKVHSKISSKKVFRFLGGNTIKAGRNFGTRSGKKKAEETSEQFAEEISEEFLEDPSGRNFGVNFWRPTFWRFLHFWKKIGKEIRKARKSHFKLIQDH